MASLKFQTLSLAAPTVTKWLRQKTKIPEPVQKGLVKLMANRELFEIGTPQMFRHGAMFDLFFNIIFVRA
jgi:hypothetical protein